MHCFIIISVRVGAKIKRNHRYGIITREQMNAEVKPNSLLKGVQPEMPVTLKVFPLLRYRENLTMGFQTSTN